MKIRHALPMLLIASVITLGFIAGCGKKSDSSNSSSAAPNPHDIPMTQEEKDALKKEVPTYDKALVRIKKFADTIKTETTGGNPEKAHRALDEIDLVLGWLPQIAKDSKVPKDQWTAIVKNSEALDKFFDAVHARIDAKKAPDYKAVSAGVEKALKALEEIKTK